MSRRVLAAVPAAAVLVPDVSPTPPQPAVEELGHTRAAIRTIADQISDQHDIVIVTSGERAVVTTAGGADLGGYGYPHIAMPMFPAPSADAFAQAAGVPRESRVSLGGEVAVLAHLIGAAARNVMHVTVPPAHAQSSRLIKALAASSVHVVFQGDLSACLTERSPGFVADGAQDWDARALTALRASNVHDLAALGPDEAERVQARGWAPLLAFVELCVATGMSVDAITYAAPLGVGYVTAVAETPALVQTPP